MHASSWENMVFYCDRYLNDAYLDGRQEVRVLDIGGADVNGSYRSLFDTKPFRYQSADISVEGGVDIQMDDPYHIPVADESIDVVISGQMLEHCEFFWMAFTEMVRILKPDGYIFLIAPSAGPIHRHPVDCYRFYPDSYRALAKWANCQLVDVRLDQRGPWNDLVGVFSKTELRKGAKSVASRWQRLRDSTKLERVRSRFRDQEIKRGRIGYLKMLKTIHALFQPQSYLEIGVRHGESFKLATCHAIGVDPDSDANKFIDGNRTMVTQSSDEFFETGANDLLSSQPDLFFIDGMHLFEYALRDFMNCERHASPSSLIVIDDIYPNHPRQGQRERETHVWAGDVWKLKKCLQKYRPDLFLLPIDSRPTGMLLVAGLNPHAEVLWQKYNSIIREYNTPIDRRPPRSILRRKGALQGHATIIAETLTTLRALRNEDHSSEEVLAKLKRIGSDS